MRRLTFGFCLAPVLLLLTSCRTAPPSRSVSATPPAPRGDRLPIVALPKQALTTDELAQSLNINSWKFDLPSSPANTVNRCVLELRQPGKPTQMLTSMGSCNPTPAPAHTFALVMRPADTGGASGRNVDVAMIDSTLCMHTACANPFLNCMYWSKSAERQSDGSFVLARIAPAKAHQPYVPYRDAITLVLTIREEAMDPPAKPLIRTAGSR